MRTLGIGLYFEDVVLGDRFRTTARTVTEADLVCFVNFSWLTEEIFTDTAAREGVALPPRVVPSAMVYSMAEGLLTPMMQRTGMAFLGAQLDVKAPTCVGDTIHVECELIEARPTSKPDRGLVRTLNRVVNQQGVEVLRYNPLRMLRRRDSTT